MIRRRKSHSLLNLVSAVALLSNLILPPRTAAVAAPPPPTFTPPVESSFQGATQATVAGPMGIDVSIYDLSLRVMRTDFFIPGCAVPLQASFIFEEKFGDSPFGYGWRFVYAAGYEEAGDGSLLVGPINGQMEQFTPGDGRLTRPQPGRYQLHLDNGDIYYFDDPAHRQVTKIEAREGGFLTLAYSAVGKPTRITDHYGRHLDFSYANDKLATITDANATPVRTTSYAYDASGNLTSATDPLGNVTQYEFTSAHQLRRITEPGGNWASITYVRELSIPTEFPDGVAQISTPLGAVSFRRDIVYDIPSVAWPLQASAGRNQAATFDQKIIANYASVSDVIGGQQRTTRYDFDWSGQIYQITDPHGHSTKFMRDSQGNLTQLSDENGAVSSYVYNGAGQLIRTTDPLARVTSYTYDASGQVASITDPLNRTTHYQYDASGNLIRFTDPSSNSTSFTYNAAGKLLSVTDSLSNTVSYTYDMVGFPASVQDGAGVTETYRYSPRGDLLQIIDGRNRTTSYSYDSLGRASSITNPAGETTRFSYDSNGSLTQLFDPGGRTVDYSYDLAGRPVKLADALGEVHYTYDAAGNITTISDGEGNRDTFSYDLNGRLTSRSDGLNRSTTFTYDPAGNLTRRTDPIGQTTVYTYSAASQLTGIGYPDGSSVSYAYDAAGNLLQEANSTVTVNYTYDDANRLTSVVAAGKTISYTYDAAGRRASMTDPDGNTTSYSYDGGGRLRTVTDSLAGTISYTYDAAGKLARLDRANGVYTIYTYDDANRLQTITHFGPGGSTLDSFTYTYDKAGNRTSVTSAQSGTTSYAYDGRYQLSGVTYPDGTSTSYTYDLAGNRLAENGTAYQYDAAAQLLNAGTTSYLWDDRGNQIRETVSSSNSDFSYDHENRLTAGDFSDNTNVGYAYYPDGRLYSRTDRAGQTTHLYYDGPNLLLETDGAGSTLARYTNGLYLDAWLAMDRGGQSYDYLHDGLNSITGLTDASGALAASYQYDAYGGIRAQTGGVPNPFRYTGRYWDADVGLYQYRARWYDPDNGRFTSRDPLGPMNVRQMYAYVANNPATNIDPLGLDTWSCSIRRISGGLVLGGEYNKLTCYNPSTQETCKLTQWCIKAGVVAGVQASGCKSRQYRGPRNGRDLGDSSFSWTAGGAIGVGLAGIGASGGFDTGNLDPTKSSVGAGWNICGGIGSFGAEVELGGQFCSTSVVSCSRPPEPDPSPSKPPSRPGDDHADDNYSTASPVLPVASSQLPAPNLPRLNSNLANDSLPLVGQPLVGVLWHGYAEEARALLASWGWVSTPVDIDFVPAALDVPVLFVPSGGLYGLDSAASIRARLETYVAGGGVIISLAQQHGYEFSSLPGGQLDGYGWSEDNSCFDASLYVSHYHPLLSGFGGATLTAGVDGFFSNLPNGAQTLLNRSRDGQPGLALYPYQSGWVVATSLYDDWGGANFQPPADSTRLLRDLLSWGVDANGPLLEFSPSMTVTLPISIANEAPLDAARIRFTMLDPDGQASITQTLDLPVLAGDQTVHLMEQANLPSKLGIWWVQYTLLDGNDNVVQPAVWGGRFAISNPNPATGPGKEMSLSITAPTENFVPGSATFTFHVNNFTNSPRTATVDYGFPHHTWETGDPTYGDFYGLTKAITVPAKSEVTFTHIADIVTNDRLFARLHDATFSQNAWFQIRSAPAAVDVDLLMDAEIYRRGGSGQITATLTNLQSAAHQVTLNLRATDNQGATLYQGQELVALTAAAVVTTPVTFTVPITSQAGTALFQVTAHDAGGGNLNAAHDSFTIPDSPLTFETTLPATLSPGTTSNLVVTATNNSASLNVLTATLAVTITSPDGSFQTAPSQPFALAAATSLTLTVPYTPLSAQFGEYLFELRAVDEYGEHSWTVTDLNEPAISSRFDQPAYASGDHLQLEVNVENSGRWSHLLNLAIASAVTGTMVIPLAVDAGEPASMTVDIPLPDGMTAGSYQFTSTLIPPTGNTIANTASMAVPDADLHTTLDNRLLTAGLPVSLTVSNIGGVDTAANYRAWLRDAKGITLQTISGAIPNVPPGGGAADFAFPVPDAAASGSYALGGVVTNTQAGVVRPFTILVTVDGAEAALTAVTTQTIYTQGQPITATALISNTGLFPINNGALNLAVDAPPDWSWFTHRPGQQGPAGAVNSSIVTDTAGVKWMKTHRAISAFDDGGTTFDRSDDRWQVFDTLNGLPHPYAYYVFVDAAGYKWINSGGPGGVALSVLDDGGTAFDVSDDQWLHYAATPGELHTQNIYSIAEDSSGNLWIGFPWVGVAVLDPGPDRLDKSDDGGWAFFTTANSDLSDNFVNVVAIDADGYKWFGTNNGASVLDDGGTPWVSGDDTWNSFSSGTGLPDNRVVGMAIDANGYKWFAGGGVSSGSPDQVISVLDTGPSPFDTVTDTVRLFTPTNSNLYGFINAFSLDSAGRAWFGAPTGYMGVLDVGADPFDGSGDSWGAFNIGATWGLVSLTFPDGNHLVWQGTSDGLALLDHNGTLANAGDDNQQGFSSRDGVGSYRIDAVAAGEAGMTWFGNDSGLHVLDPAGTDTDHTDDQWMLFDASDGLPAGSMKALAVDQQGYPWLAPWKEAAVLDHNGTPFNKADDTWATFDIGLGAVYDMAVDAANRKWFTGWNSSNHGLAVLDDGGTPITKTDDLTMTFAASGPLNSGMEELAIDQAGIKWIANYDEVVALMDGGTPFDPNDDTWQVINFSIPNHYPSDVAVDDQNNIWFGFNSSPNGVAVLDYNGTLTDTGDDRWAYYNMGHGLADNWVFQVAVDSRGDKWFAVDGGLSRLDDGGDPFDGTNNTWESFTSELGMAYELSPEVDVVAVGGDGNIWAGTFEYGASVGLWQGTAVWSVQQPIASLPAATTTQVITGVNGLANPGRYNLRGEYANSLGQTMATGQAPFYIVSAASQIALTLDAAPDPVAPGATIVLTGTLFNNGSTTLNSQTVTLYQDGVAKYVEGPFSVAAQSSHAFTTTTTAPLGASRSQFVAEESGGHKVELNLVVGQPVIAASAVAPTVAGSDPFSVTISLTNTGTMPGQIHWSVNNQQGAETVPPGETVLAQATAQLCADAAVPVVLTGDLNQTVNVPVTFGQSLSAAFTPAPIYPPGALSIPYTFTGTGQLDVAFTSAITISNSQGVVENGLFDAYLIASDIITGSNAFNLLPGDYDLTYNLDSGGCSLANGQESFVVAPANSLAISMAIGGPGPLLPITATLTNQGSSDFAGELRLSMDYDYQLVQPISLTVGATGVVTFAADLVLATTGVHTATITAVSGAGIEMSQTAQTFSVLGPLLNVTALPNQTTLPVSQTITLTFGVSNQGDQDGQAELRFAFGDIEEDTQVRRVAAGDTEQFDVIFFVPPELEAKQYLATYALNGQQRELLFTIQGISLTVSAAADQPSYREGDSVQLQLQVGNNLTTTEPGLYVLASIGGITQTRPFTLTATPVDLTFPMTATFGNGGLVFYGIYHGATQRGIHLNTFRLPQRQGAVTVLLDRQRYRPGDGVVATVVTTATGQLQISAPGYTATLLLSGSNEQFAFTLPALMGRGTYAVDARLVDCHCDAEGRVYQTPFDVDGPMVRVTDARLDGTDLNQGDLVSARLTVATDRVVSVTLRTAIIYPGDTTAEASARAVASPAASSQAVTLSAGPANILTATALISGTEAGLHFLSYSIVDANDESLVYAGGVEAFDLGQVSLISVSTHRTQYSGVADPVTATLSLFASKPFSGQLSLALDTGLSQAQSLDLPAGWHSLFVPLNGVIEPGPRLLTATLSSGGFSSLAQTSFEYGSDLPDLLPDPPWIQAGGPLTRTLVSLIANEGNATASPSTVHFYQGDPLSGGSLIGSVPLPAIDPGQRFPAELVWDIHGEGGDQDVIVQVDPVVVEFNQANNSARSTISLPVLEARLLITPDVIATGGTIDVAARLLNLQGALGLPATAAIEILDPGGAIVFTDTWSVLLAAGEERTLTASWSSGTAVPGGYLVKLTATSTDGIFRDSAFFTLAADASSKLYLPIIVKSGSQTAVRPSGRLERTSSGIAGSEPSSDVRHTIFMFPIILSTWVVTWLNRRRRLA